MADAYLLQAVSKAVAQALQGSAEARSVANAMAQYGNAEAISKSCASSFFNIAKSCADANSFALFGECTGAATRRISDTSHSYVYSLNLFEQHARL